MTSRAARRDRWCRDLPRRAVQTHVGLAKAPALSPGGLHGPPITAFAQTTGARTASAAVAQWDAAASRSVRRSTERARGVAPRGLLTGTRRRAAGSRKTIAWARGTIDCAPRCTTYAPSPPASGRRRDVRAHRTHRSRDRRGTWTQEGEGNLTGVRRGRRNYYRIRAGAMFPPPRRSGRRPRCRRTEKVQAYADTPRARRDARRLVAPRCQTA